MRERSDGTAALKSDRHYTYRDYRTWPEEERCELIAGTAYAMSPAPRREHQGLVTRLLAQLSAFAASAGCRSYVSPIDVFFPAGDEELDEIDVVLQPDIALVCDPGKLTRVFLGVSLPTGGRDSLIVCRLTTRRHYLIRCNSLLVSLRPQPRWPWRSSCTRWARSRPAWQPILSVYHGCRSLCSSRVSG